MNMDSGNVGGKTSLLLNYSSKDTLSSDEGAAHRPVTLSFVCILVKEATIIRHNQDNQNDSGGVQCVQTITNVALHPPPRGEKHV